MTLLFYNENTKQTTHNKRELALKQNTNKANQCHEDINEEDYYIQVKEFSYKETSIAW